MPADALGRARVAQWLAFEQEWVMRGIAGARFRLLTGRDPGDRVDHARGALDLLELRLDASPWAAGAEPTIADVGLFAYTHVAPDAGFDLIADWPAVAAWVQRVEALPGFVNDLVPYPDNARPGAGRSIYD